MAIALGSKPMPIPPPRYISLTAANIVAKVSFALTHAATTLHHVLVHHGHGIGVEATTAAHHAHTTLGLLVEATTLLTTTAWLSKVLDQVT